MTTHGIVQGNEYWRTRKFYTGTNELTLDNYFDVTNFCAELQDINGNSLQEITSEDVVNDEIGVYKYKIVIPKNHKTLFLYERYTTPDDLDKEDPIKLDIDKIADIVNNLSESINGNFI